jgi:RNA polymerase sigma factor (sigma-70 family)
MNDQELLHLWTTRRDAEAFSELVTRHAAMVYHTCLRVLGNRADAEEITQDCFLRMADEAGSIHHSLAGWLYTVATRRSLNRIRGEKSRRTRDQAYAEQHDESVKQEWDDLQQFVDEAILELPDKLREPMVLHFLEGKTHVEVAEILDVPRRTVSSRIERAVQETRKVLSHRGVVTPAATLSALLVAESANAAPKGIVSALGKLAISGKVSATGVGAATASLATGGLIAGIAKGIASFAAVVALLVAAKVLSPSSPIQESEAEILAVEQAAPSAAEPVQLATLQVTEETPPTPPARPTPSRLSSLSLNGEWELRGRVLQGDGNMVPSARVRLVELPPVLTGRPNPYLESASRNFRRVMRGTETRSDSEGRFTFTGVPAGNYHLIGWTDTAMGAVDVHPSKVYHEFHLYPAETLSGRVVDGTGSPIAGAIVRPRFSGDAPQDANMTAFHVATDAEGQYVFPPLWRGRWRLYAAAPKLATAIVNGVMPGTDMAEISLSPGTRLDGRIQVAGTSAATLNAKVYFSGPSIFDRHVLAADTDGRFGVSHMPAGRVLIRVFSDRYVTATSKVRSEIPEGVDEYTLNVPLVEGGRVHGTLRWAEDGSPADGIKVQAGMQSAVSDAKGNYEIVGLPPGEVQIYPLRDGHRSPGLGSASVVAFAGETKRGIDITLSRTGAIQGVVVNTQGERMAGLVVYASGDRTVTAQDGTFRLDVDPPLRADDTFLPITVSGSGWVTVPGQGVDLAAAPIENAVIRVEQAASIAGTLLKADGSPMDNTRIRFSPTDSTPRPGQGAFFALTDWDGNFSVEGLYAATYRIQPYRLLESASNPMHQEEPLNLAKYVKVEPGQFVSGETLQEGEIDHSSGYSVSGQVFHRNGTPAVRADLYADVPYRGNSFRRVQTAITDTDGRFTVSGLNDPSVRIYASDRRTGLRSAAIEIQLPTRDDVRLILDDASAQKGTLTFQAIDAQTGQSLTSVQVFAIPGGHYEWPRRSNIPSIRCQPDGLFRYPNAPAGTVTAMVWWYGYVPAFTLAEVPPNGTSEPVVFALNPGATIEGTVHDPSGNPIIGAQVGLGNAHSIREYLLGEDQPNVGISRSDGSFTLTGLPGGRLTVAVDHDDWAHTLVPVSMRGGTQHLRIVMRRGGTVRGALAVGPSIPPRPYVYAKTEGADWRNRVRGYVDSRGNYQIEHVPPGEVEVYVSGRLEERDSGLRELRRATVSDGAETIVNLTLVPGRTALYGVVSSIPIDVHRAYAGVDNGHNRNTVRIQGDGSYLMEGVIAGSANFVLHLYWNDGRETEEFWPISVPEEGSLEHHMIYPG